MKRCLPPSATFFPAGVYTGPTAPETNHFARHGLYCIYIGTRPPALARRIYSVLWSIPQYIGIRGIRLYYIFIYNSGCGLQYLT